MFLTVPYFEKLRDNAVPGRGEEKIKPLINDAEAQKNASFKIKISYGQTFVCVKRDN